MGVDNAKKYGGNNHNSILAHDYLSTSRTCDIKSFLNSDRCDESDKKLVKFSDLSLSKLTYDSLQACGFEYLTPIQKLAIPLGRFGLDLIVQSKAGTGKTCVFGTIALETITYECNLPQVLILVPTKEIAFQIKLALMRLGQCYKSQGFKVAAFVGGYPLPSEKPQPSLSIPLNEFFLKNSIDSKSDIIEYESSENSRLKASQNKINQKLAELYNSHILIGTPGRIKHLIYLKYIDVSNISLLVMDEVDQIFRVNEQEFMVNWIFSTLPPERQIITTSATYSSSLIRLLSDEYMNSPQICQISPSLQNVVNQIALVDNMMANENSPKTQKNNDIDDNIEDNFDDEMTYLPDAISNVQLHGVRQYIVDFSDSQYLHHTIYANSNSGKNDKSSPHLQEINHNKRVSFEQKLTYICALLQHIAFKQCFIFVNHAFKLEALGQKLKSYFAAQNQSNYEKDDGKNENYKKQSSIINARCLCSQQPIQKRLATLRDFVSGKFKVLICTDLAARGIDIRSADLVINLDVPLHPDKYVHRIGRCGRFGSYGLSVTLVHNNTDRFRLYNFANLYNLDLYKFPPDLSLVPTQFIQLLALFDNKNSNDENQTLTTTQVVKDLLSQRLEISSLAYQDPDQHASDSTEDSYENLLLKATTSSNIINTYENISKHQDDLLNKKTGEIDFDTTHLTLNVGLYDQFFVSLLSQHKRAVKHSGKKQHKNHDRSKHSISNTLKLLQNTSSPNTFTDPRKLIQYDDQLLSVQNKCNKDISIPHKNRDRTKRFSQDLTLEITNTNYDKTTDNDVVHKNSNVDDMFESTQNREYNTLLTGVYADAKLRRKRNSRPKNEDNFTLKAGEKDYSSKNVDPLNQNHTNNIAYSNVRQLNHPSQVDVHYIDLYSFDLVTTVLKQGLDSYQKLSHAMDRFVQSLINKYDLQSEQSLTTNVFTDNYTNFMAIFFDNRTDKNSQEDDEDKINFVIKEFRRFNHYTTQKNCFNNIFENYRGIDHKFNNLEHSSYTMSLSSTTSSLIKSLQQSSENDSHSSTNDDESCLELNNPTICPKTKPIDIPSSDLLYFTLKHQLSVMT